VKVRSCPRNCKLNPEDYKPLLASANGKVKRASQETCRLNLNLIFAFGGKANHTMKYLIPFLCILSGVQTLFAQQDTVRLNGTSISGNHLLDKNQTQSEIILNDSILKKNQPSLTQLLNFNSPIYFKENGAGMISSPSFRGTTASQTVVLWNGININSQTTGQTDFNSITINAYDQIKIKGGAGNVAETNSSVGGSVELINDLKFKNTFSNEILLRYGSFNTFNGNFNSKFSSKDLSFNLNYSRYSSDNDFKFPGKKQKNINGEFYNNNFSVAAGYRINSNNILKFFGNLYNAKRNLSVITEFAAKSRYEDYNSRSLIEWENNSGKFNSDLKFAYLSDEYRFFQNIAGENFDSGKVYSLVSRYNLKYNLNSNLRLVSQFEYIRNSGFSGNQMDNKTRNSGSAGLSIQHQLIPKFYYELSVRQELNENYGNPLLYSLGGNFSVLKLYNLKFNLSKNFRVPTYNDLYWPGAGNPDLKPETSYQAEIGNEFHNRFFNFTVTGFYNSVENLIRWIPNSNPLGWIIWQPENVDDVKIYGLESVFNFKKSFGKNDLNLNATYAYTVSEDRKTKKQMIYVPFHKATASLSYYRNGFSVYYQFLFNGKVFTTTDNDSENELPHYFLSNLGMDYGFGKSKNWKIGFQILNLMDYEYQSVPSRPMPGRNFQIYVNIKI
jgi:iron complex outermembrane receptor protein